MYSSLSPTPFLLPLVAGLAAATLGCRSEPEPDPTSGRPSGPARVFAVNYPLAWMAERLGGGEIEVLFPVPAGADPAWWEPTTEQAQTCQQADVILLNGADYAKWTLRTSLPMSRVVVTTREFPHRIIEVPDAVVHSHGGEGEHSHAELASETWLDSQLAVEQARMIRWALGTYLGLPADDLDVRLTELKADLGAIDVDLASAFAEAPFAWFTSRPGFTYLGRQHSLGLEFASGLAEEEPSEENWKRFEEKVAGIDEEIMMLWDAEPSPPVRDRLGELGVGILVFETGASRPESGDYLEVMRGNLARLRATIDSASSPSP